MVNLTQTRPRRASSKRPSRPKPKGNGQPTRTRESLANGRTVEGAQGRPSRSRRAQGGGFHGGNAAFCSRRPRKIHSAAPFCAIETNQVLRHSNQNFANLRCSGAAPGWFSPACFALQNTQKREENRIFRPIPPPREKSTHRSPELIKFPMPAARHEKKRNPAMEGSRGQARPALCARVLRPREKGPACLAPVRRPEGAHTTTRTTRRNHRAKPRNPRRNRRFLQGNPRTKPKGTRQECWVSLCFFACVSCVSCVAPRGSAHVRSRI